MGAPKFCPVAALRDRSDRGPALRAQPGGHRFFGAKRQEDAAALAPAQPGGHQRIEVDRKADGLFLPPIGMDDRIAAAPADLARYALANQGKADPAGRKSTRLNSSHICASRMPSSA